MYYRLSLMVTKFPRGREGWEKYLGKSRSKGKEVGKGGACLENSKQWHFVWVLE